MTNYNKAFIRNNILQIDWEAILSPLSDNTVDMAITFQEIFESILNLRAKLRKKRVRREFAPWLTPSLKKLIFERD